MCVIISMIKTVPSLKTFKKCEEANGDGGGISWIDGDMVKWKKGIKAEEVYEIAKKAGGNCVAHFRIGTIGGKDFGLCHPFPITNDCPTSLEGTAKRVLFHNGHWHKWDDVCMEMVLFKNAYFPGGDWSDSRAMAWLISHCNSSFLKFLGQKVVIHSAKNQLYFGEFQKKDDVYYSNLLWDTKVWSNVWDGHGETPHWLKSRWKKDSEEQLKELEYKYGADYANQFKSGYCQGV